MKTLIGAIALTLAVPAVAQTAPAADSHASHARHQQDKHDCKACCEKMKQHGGKMECMGKTSEAEPASIDAGSHQGPEGHAN